MSICIAKPIEPDLDFAIAFSFPNLYLLSRAVVFERRNNAETQLCTRY